jgi:hypothetical protein
MLILMMAVTLAANPSQAQKLIKKELQTENNEKDGFQYQWNRYTYLQGKDTLDAAFDLNNKRITPNGYRKYEKEKVYQGVRYVGGGRFQVYSKNTDAFGNMLISGYNVKGECVLPETVYTSIFYVGDGFFDLTTRNELGKQVAGLYDYNGNCIIPESKGFTFYFLQEGFIQCDQERYCALYDYYGNCVIPETKRFIFFFIKDGFIECSRDSDEIRALYDLRGNCIIPETKGFDLILIKNGFIKCENENLEINAIYDMQGNCIISEDLGYTWIAYYPEYEFFWCDKGEIECTISKDGQYYAEGDHYSDYNRNEFERKKRRVPNWSRNNNSKTTSSSSGSYSSTGNVGHTLLYKGAYWICGANGDVDGMIEVYSDCLVLAGLSTIPFKSLRSNGDRVYATGDGPRFVVDSYFNIRRENSLYDCTFRKKSNSSSGNYGNGYNGSTNTYQGGNEGSTSTQQKTHQCGLCGGSGEITDDTTNPSFGNTKYCEKCKKTVPAGHFHKTCPSCKGKGYW